ncbi:hypothetical protein SAMN03159297_01900 [Pseudomonas sp. NFACC45]|nr:hypothetical protein SAMN03159297_01900 [Pseudomonas sp. NFACC45]
MLPSFFAEYTHESFTLTRCANDCFWPKAAIRERLLLAVYDLSLERTVAEYARKEFAGIKKLSVRFCEWKNQNPTRDVGFFRWRKYYCRGSTLSNTRFASNELSSISC